MGQEEAPVPVCGLGLFGPAVLARLRPFGVPRRAMPSAGTVVAAGDQSVVPASLPALRGTDWAGFGRRPGRSRFSFPIRMEWIRP